MRKYLVAFVVVVLTFLTIVQAAEYYTKHKGDHRRGEPTEDMALVYVFRPAMVGGAIKTWAFADDQLIGVSKPKGYYFALVPPGKRIIWSKAENTSALEIELEAGQAYYFQIKIRMGIGKARVKLEQIDEAQAEKLFEKCSFCEFTETGKAKGAEIVANRMDRAINKADERKQKEAD